MRRLLGRLALAWFPLTVLCNVGSPAIPSMPCAAAQAGTVRVTLIVDFGELDSAAPRAECFTVPEGTTSAQLLALRAKTRGVATPRYGDTGLLCSIDGAPNAGCAERSGSAYRYWSYWIGTSEGTWRYATIGPAQRRVVDGSVEGWHYITGGGTGSDNAPRLTPTTACISTTPVDTTMVSTPPSTTPTSTTPTSAAPEQQAEPTAPSLAVAAETTTASVPEASTTTTTSTTAIDISKAPTSLDSSSIRVDPEASVQAEESSVSRRSWIAPALFALGAAALAIVQVRRTRLRDM